MFCWLKVEPKDLSALRGLQELETDQLSKSELEKLENDEVGLAGGYPFTAYQPVW